MSEIFTANNIAFMLKGLKLTLYISLISIFLSMIFGSILGILRSTVGGFFGWLAAIYIEVVRNIPNLLWIYVVFIAFKLPSFQAGVVSFTIFTTAAIAEIVRGGLNSVGKGQWEAARSQGFSTLKTLIYIIMPQAIRSMVPALVSQYVTVIKDTCFLWSVVAIQEFTGRVTILMGRYYKVEQIFIFYAILVVVYFLINYAISSFSRWLHKKWAY